MLKRTLPICLILFLSCQDDLVSPYDECGVLNGDNSSCTDCAGVVNGDSVVDCTGVCNGESVEDCEGTCNGNAIVDDCGECNGDNSSCTDCAGVVNGDSVVDCAGVCNGESIEDCEGVCDGGAIEDCNGDCGGSALEDECGICGGEGPSYTCSDDSIVCNLDECPLPAPELFEPYNITENSITLSWSVIDHDSFQEYRLYRSVSSNVSEDSNLISTISNSYSNTYNDTGLQDGTTYYYKVFSVSNNGTTFASNEMYSTTSLGIGDWGIISNFDSNVSLEAIYAFSDENVWVAGSKNNSSIIYHFVGGSWIETYPPDIGHISDIDFSSENDGWAVSGEGVLRYNGAIWSIQNELEGALSVDVNSSEDVWFADRWNQGCYRYYNGNYISLGIYGYEIEVEGNTGVIIGYTLNNNVNSYFYNGLSWTQGPDVHYSSGSSPSSNFAKVSIHNGEIYVATNRGGASTNKLARYDNSSWTTLYGGGYDTVIYGMDVQNSNSIWFFGGNPWGYIMNWNGSSATSHGNLGHIDDIHFFSNTTAWACGNNKVFRYE